ncbi:MULTISPECIES: type II secretion system minor pseudopilin [Rhodanobacter]|uniref:Type II secretion system protein K n=1 Tax=Rhodanobacter hydrolyticus TaxID=2250595 RepID=A0ABW8JB28_9GAMM|nr:type II secretion system protein GspK [Rhodanobacter sp. 7MK24]MBD8881840.1 general secretion pathway protein GspK [Rhodanobacter sp. 7MK24]
MKQPAGQRGVALLLVLWACTLLAILLGGYAVLAHTEALQTRYQFAEARAHYAAEAGVMRALVALQDPDLKRRWVADGRAYPFPFDDATVQVSMIDEGGKVDLNAASPEVLQGLFRAAGLDAAAAGKLAANVVDWRSFVAEAGQADSARAAYAAAGRDYGPRHGPFATLQELQLVLGMTPELYQHLEPAITIWSGRAIPDPTTAPPLVLAAIPGVDPQQVQALLAARQQNGGSGTSPIGGGITHSIRSQAELADGTRAVIRATIRLQQSRMGSQPYTVLRWQEGDGE